MEYLKCGSFFIVSSLLFTTFSSVSFVTAQEQNTNIQAQCFATLKENMKEAVLFAEPLLELEKMSYADLSAKLSEKKKMLSSFDLTVDQPILGLRLYSFGNQTGYTHPPKSVLPISTKSETWGDPVKEYVVMEEYVTDPKGNEHFLDCVFLQVDSDNLMNVNQKNYATDSYPISLLKITSDDSYIAWYNQSPAFDYEEKHLMTWKRMIVYPKNTQNEYFNRYDVVPAILTNKVDSFDVLKFFLDKKISFISGENRVPTFAYTIIGAKNDEVKNINPPQELLQIPSTGINVAFRQATYYQAIVNKFPEFGTLLSVNGVLKYNTFIETISQKNLTNDTKSFLAIILNNMRLVNAYYYSEDKVTNPKLEKLIPLIQNTDETLKDLMRGDTLDKISNSKDGMPVSEGSHGIYSDLFIIGILSSIFLSVSLFSFSKRRMKINQ